MDKIGTNDHQSELNKTAAAGWVKFVLIGVGFDTKGLFNLVSFNI